MIVRFTNESQNISKYILKNVEIYCPHLCGNCELLTSRYTAHLKDAKKTGVKKGASAGLGIGLTSFFIFFVHAVGFWFGAYLIQYQDATSGDIITVNTFVKKCHYM